MSLASENYYLLILLAILLPFSFIIRRIYFHPLSSYPGPFLGRFSHFYPYLGVFQSRRTMLQVEMLQKYGSPCRIATNELLFSDPRSVIDIYGQHSHPCTKDPATYDSFTATASKNVFSVVDRKQHNRLRRLLSHSFSANGLLEKEHRFAETVEAYIDTTYRTQEGKVIEVYERNHFLYLDIISQLVMGKSFDCLKGQNLQASKEVEAYGFVTATNAFFPGVLHIPLKLFRENKARVQSIIRYSEVCIKDCLERVENFDNLPPAERSFLQTLAAGKDAETGTSLSTEELVENSLIFLHAGSGTTAIATTYFIWECGRRPEIRKRLVEEIRTAFPDPESFPTYEEASKLQYLSNAVKETLRLRGPLTAGAPRISPGRRLGDHFIPVGTIVSNNPYATCRDPEFFPEPHSFNPSRWEKDAVTPEMSYMNRPFSYGPRNCIGRHLAEITLLLTITRLYQLYDVIPDASMTDEMMRQIDHGTLEPCGKKLLVTITPAATPAAANSATTPLI